MAFIAKGGAEHIVFPPTLLSTEPLIPVMHFTRQSPGSWTFAGAYESVAMGIARDFSILNEAQDIVFADHGLELSGVSADQWPFGHVNLARVNGGSVEWRRISQDRGFYHSVATGGIAEIIVGMYGDNPAFDVDRYSYVIYSKAHGDSDIVLHPIELGTGYRVRSGQSWIILIGSLVL
ncbi:MAG TPA: hypothetical protein VIN61_06530 [Gammaproteobacteria bacterium]